MAISNSSSTRSVDLLEPAASSSNKYHQNPFLKVIRGFCNPHGKHGTDFGDDDDDLNDGYNEQYYTVMERSTVIASSTMSTTHSPSPSSSLKDKSIVDTDSLPALTEEDDQSPVPSSDGSGHEWVNDLIIENDTAAVIEPKKKSTVDKTTQRWFYAAIALALLLLVDGMWKMIVTPVAVKAPPKVASSSLQQVFLDNAVFNSSVSIYGKLLAPLSHGTLPNFNTDLVLTEEPVELEVEEEAELATHEEEHDATELLDFTDEKEVSSDTEEGVVDHDSQGEIEVAGPSSEVVGDEAICSTKSLLDYVKQSDPVQDSKETVKDEALNDINRLEGSDEQSDPQKPSEEKPDGSASSSYLMYGVAAVAAVFAALDWAGVAEKKVSSSDQSADVDDTIQGRKEQRKMKKKERRRSTRVEA